MIVLTAVFFDTEEDAPDTGGSIIGIAYDIKETQNGYTFSFEDTDGIRMRCFARTAPVSSEVYIIKGKFSEDGNMFFAEHMERIHQNELYRN